MDRKILKNQINEDGSHTRIEKITQTPTDGFVTNKKHRAGWDYPGQDVGMFERGHFKGHKTTVTYFRSHTKKTRVLFYAAYILVALIFVTIFIALISTQNVPDIANKYKLYLVGIIVFFIYGFIKSVMIFKKQDRTEKND